MSAVHIICVIRTHRINQWSIEFQPGKSAILESSGNRIELDTFKVQTSKVRFHRLMRQYLSSPLHLSISTRKFSTSAEHWYAGIWTKDCQFVSYFETFPLTETLKWTKIRCSWKLAICSLRCSDWPYVSLYFGSGGNLPGKVRTMIHMSNSPLVHSMQSVDSGPQVLCF